MLKKIVLVLMGLFFTLIFTNKSFATYTIYLRAEAINKVMPDGTVIPMWGFARDTSFESHDGEVTVPGPVITVPESENDLEIYLENNLPVPISLVIPGQYLDNNGPVRNPSGRIQSFSHETPPNNTVPVKYEWQNFKAGTYLLHSGTEPAIQVPMGLYCVIKKNASTGQAYGPNTTFSDETVLVFSEVDPELNSQVNSNPGIGTISSINFKQKYLLLNGMPYFSGKSPIDLGVAGSPKLIRIVNAGVKDRVFSMVDVPFKAIAEDGNEYPYHQNLLALIVSAGQTKDVIFTPIDPGYYPVIDRKLGLSNYTNTTGGLLAYLKVRSANEYTLNVNKAGTGSGKVVVISKPGGIECGNDCSETYNENTVVRLKAIPDENNKFTGWSGACSGVGDCEIVLSSNMTVTANFAPLPNIIVNTPNGGEILPTGSNYLISWQSPNNAVKFNLFYSVNNGSSWFTIAKNITRKDYLWNVPAINNNTKKALIRVVGYNTSNSQVGIDKSDAPFTIEVMKVTYPNSSGLTFSSGTPWQITWITNLTKSPVANTVVQVSTNGGLTWKTLATLNGNPGTYSGTVPAVSSVSNKCLVRVILRNSNNVVIGSDVSDNFFTITP